MFLVCCLTVAAIVRFWPREPLLLDRAVRVADTEDWGLVYDNYTWITDRSVLYTQSDSVYLEDIRTQTKTKLSLLSKLTNTLSIYHASHEFSPDRQWVLSYQDATRSVIATTLSGEKHATWSIQTGGVNFVERRMFWLPDSRHWLELLTSDDLGIKSVTNRANHSFKAAHIYDVDAPDQITTVPLDLSDEQAYRLTTSTNRNGQIFHTENSCDDRTACTLTVYESDARQLARPPRIHPIALSAVACRMLENIVVSPDGGRVAFLTESEAQTLPFWNRFLRRLWPSLPENTPATYRLWTCGLDGTNQHEIGKVSISETDGSWRQLPTELKWTPDGKRLSFVYRDALWTVAAE